MKRSQLGLLICGILSLSQTAAVAQSRLDPLNDILTTPKLLFQHGDQLNLDAAQKEFIQSQLQQSQEKFPELQKKLQQEMTALGEMLHETAPDEAKSVAQLDKVLQCEREI